MKRLVLASMVACGGSSPKPVADPPPPAPMTTATVDTTPTPIPPEPPPEPAPEPPPDPARDDPSPLPRDPAHLYADLGDVDGPIAGLPAFVISHRASKIVCGGAELRIKRNKREKIAAADVPLARVLELAPPTGLDFGPKRNAKSREKFFSWLDDLTKRMTEAGDHYKEQMKSNDVVQNVAAAARVAQVARLGAARFARLEIPVDVRKSSEAVDAFCETLIDKAEPLLLYAHDAVRACATHAPAAGPGWWTPVCTKPAPATP